MTDSDAVRAEIPRFRPLVAAGTLLVTVAFMVLPAAAGVLILAGVVR